MIGFASSTRPAGASAASQVIFSAKINFLLYLFLNGHLPWTRWRYCPGSDLAGLQCRVASRYSDAALSRGRESRHFPVGICNCYFTLRLHVHDGGVPFRTMPLPDTKTAFGPFHSQIVIPVKMPPLIGPESTRQLV